MRGRSTRLVRGETVGAVGVAEWVGLLLQLHRAVIRQPGSDQQVGVEHATDAQLLGEQHPGEHTGVFVVGAAPCQEDPPT